MYDFYVLDDNIQVWLMVYSTCDSSVENPNLVSDMLELIFIWNHLSKFPFIYMYFKFVWIGFGLYELQCVKLGF